MTIRLLPLALSVVGTGYFLFFIELDRKWKLLALGLTGTALGLQLMPDRIRFVVPLVLHSIVAICWKLE